MQDEPTPIELTKAVADFLRSDITPLISGHQAFKLRVAINILDLVTRQLTREEGSDAAEAERLRALLGMLHALRDAVPKAVTVLSVPTPPEILSNYKIDPDHLKTPDFAIDFEPWLAQFQPYEGPVVPQPMNMGQDRLLQGNPLLERSVRHRFPYLDPLNHVQVELLKEHRAQNPDEQVLRGIQLTINGISAGLRNTG